MIFNQRIGGAGGASASILAYGDALQSTDTVYAEKDGKRVNGVWKQVTNPDFHGLPAEYQEVEYLESTGDQIINTLCDVSNGYKMSFDVYWEAIPSVSGYQNIFGCENLSFPYGYTGWRTNSGGEFDQQPSDGKTYVLPTRITTAITCAPGNTTNPLAIFGGNQGGTLGRFSKAKLYSLSISTLQNEPLRNLVPCYRKSDHKPGLYDTVNDVFYVNQGAGADFLVGAAVPQYKTGFEIAPIREYGTWVLTATHGGSTKTINVLVDAAEVFAVEVTA